MTPKVMQKIEQIQRGEAPEKYRKGRHFVRKLPPFGLCNSRYE